MFFIKHKKLISKVIKNIKIKEVWYKNIHDMDTLVYHHDIYTKFINTHTTTTTTTDFSM